MKVTVVGLVALGIVAIACGDTTTNPRPAEIAGSGGMADVPLGQQCTVFTLSELCQRRACPASQMEVEPNCEMGNIHRFATSCGGIALGTAFSLGTEYWFFDAAGTLTGYTISSDIGSACVGAPPGGKTTIYGDICQVGERLPDSCP